MTNNPEDKSRARVRVEKGNTNMDANSNEVTALEIWKPRTLVIGGVVGASIGLLAAYLILQRGEKDKPPEFTVGEAVKIGVLVLGLLRSIANL